MKTRIIASYLTKVGFYHGEREVDLDEYANIEVKTVDDGLKLIRKNEENGIGTILMEKQDEEFATWETIQEHYVDHGEIYDTEIF